METIILKSDNKKEIIDLALYHIKKGGVIVFPTDTVYGMLCDATNKKAVNKVFKIKKRNYQKFFPVFVRDVKMAKKIAKINKEQESFLKKTWPGKITVVLEKKPIKIYGADKRTIALRIANNDLIKEILKKIKSPLVQTSANISGKKTPKTAKKIIKEFKNKKEKPDLIIDGGFLKTKHSTLIDLTTFPYKILRS